MALLTSVSGAYGFAYDGGSAGETSDGFNLKWKFPQKLIKGTAYGETAIDSIYLGAEVFLMFTSIQSHAVIFSSTPSTQFGWPVGTAGRLGTIGSLAVSSSSPFAKAVVLTARSGTTAATLGPATLTASKTMLKEDSQVMMNMNNRLRKIPCEFRLFPYDVASEVFGFFTYT